MASAPALKVTIVGAGIGGLSTALALSHTNPDHQITILESNSSLSEFGAGIQLSANSTRIVDAWGLTEALRKVAFECSSMSIRRWEDNSELMSMMYNPISTWLYGWPHWQIYRPDLQRVLYEGVQRQPNISVRFGKAVKEVDHASGAVTTADGEVIEGDVAVAADGIWSKTRQCLPAAAKVEPTAYHEHTYRVVIPRERMLSNPVTAPLMSAPETKAWVGPETVILAYTVASDSLYNFLISVPRPNPDAPLAAWNQPGDIKTMRSLVDGWCEEAQALTSLVQDGECTIWTLGEVLDVSAYASDSGRMAIIGDAAHAILPHSGQGAGMAMEDAASLAEFLNFLETKDDLPKVMQAWSQFRVARVEQLRTIARGNAGILTMPDGPAQVARDAKFAAIQRMQKEQNSGLTSEEIMEKVIQNKPAPDPNARSNIEPGGAMWINGFDVFEESRRYYKEQL